MSLVSEPKTAFGRFFTLLLEFIPPQRAVGTVDEKEKRFIFGCEEIGNGESFFVKNRSDVSGGRINIDDPV